MYEPKQAKLTYTVKTTYLPDFITPSGVYVEAKGYFRTAAEARKYQAVREQYPAIKIVFVFANKNKPIPWGSRRKDGTRMTHSEWADVNGFEWYTIDTIGVLL